MGDTGWVLSPGNYKLFASNLNNALNYSNDKLKEYGKRARTKIVNNYSIEIVKNQYASLYKSVL